MTYLYLYEKSEATSRHKQAFIIVELATNEDKEIVPDGKNHAAVALGRLGGLKGCNARAASLTPKKRSAIAKKAAAKRWSKYN